MKKTIVIIFTIIFLTAVMLFSSSAFALETWEVPSKIIYPQSMEVVTDENILVDYEVFDDGDGYYTVVFYPYGRQGSRVSLYFDPAGEFASYSNSGSFSCDDPDLDNIYNIGFYSEDLNSAENWVIVCGIVDDQNTLLNYEYYFSGQSRIFVRYQGVYYDWDPVAKGWYKEQTVDGKYEKKYYDIDVELQDERFRCPEIVFSGETLVLCGKKVETSDVLVLPGNLTEIGAEAFAGISARRVVVPDSCTLIGSRAFASCSNLIEILVPQQTQIAEDAFYGSENVKIIRR